MLLLFSLIKNNIYRLWIIVELPNFCFNPSDLLTYGNDFDLILRNKRYVFIILPTTYL